MDNCVTLLHRDAGGVAERNLTRLVEFMGGTVQAVKVEAGGQVEILRGLIPAGGCVIASAPAIGAEVWAMLLELKAQVLVYGFDSAAQSSGLLKVLTGGSVVGVEAQNAGRISVGECREVCGPMAGQSFDANGAHIPFAFSAGSFTPLLSAGRQPFFVRVNDHGSQWMLLAGAEFADLDDGVPKGTSVLKFFPGLAPVMMFLRAAAPAAFWHNDAPTACFIVDDPPLKSRYGFLEYQKLLALMDRQRFSTSIAFIPWNYRRSQRRVTEMFARRPGACSLSVHGCDHTRGEFGGTDARVLREQAQLALERMAKHRELTGLGFDDVMVFPQGIFSTAALAALKACGYLAAVNSTPYPVDGEQSLILRDLLGIAVTRFSGFPLFARRYPQHIAELAFDLFLGKPALLVEHHGFFQDGYRALAETVGRVGRLDARLRWTNLADACSRACLQRTDANGVVQVAFATGRLVLENETKRAQEYVLTQGDPANSVKWVVVNGGRVPLERGPDGFCVRLSLAAGQPVNIRVDHMQAAAPLQQNVDRMHQFKVFLRRNLCEFRDNYVATSRLFRKQPVPVE